MDKISFFICSYVEALASQATSLFATGGVTIERLYVATMGSIFN